MRGPLRERRGTWQDRGVVDRVRLLELGGIVELPEHQADVSPYGETPGGVPAQADVGSDGELRAELVPAGVARRRSADGHAQDASTPSPKRTTTLISNPSPLSLCRSFPAAVGCRAAGAPWGRRRAARRRGATDRAPRRPQ